MNKIALLSIIMVVLVGIGSYFFIIKQKNMEQDKVETFTGTIDKVAFEIPWDGDNYMIIDGKQVIFEQPRMADDEPIPVGTLQGFDFGSSTDRAETAKKYYGKQVEVHAKVLEGFNSEGDIEKSYSLYGDSSYYIKVK